MSTASGLSACKSSLGALSKLRNSGEKQTWDSVTHPMCGQEVGNVKCNRERHNLVAVVSVLIICAVDLTCELRIPYDTASTVFLTGQGGSLYLPLSLCDVARRLPTLHHRHSLPPHPLLPLQQSISPPQNAVLKNFSISSKNPV